MNDADVVRAVGGHRIIAAALNITPKVALHFERRGIPFRYRAQVKALARRKKVPLPPDFLETQRKP